MSYRVERQMEGVYFVLDEDGDRANRVSRFEPGAMVSVSGQGLYSRAQARAVAKAMVMLADELEKAV